MFKFNSLAACSSASDPKQPKRRDVVDIFGVDASSGDILQLHLEKDVWLRARMPNPYTEQGTRFAGPITANALTPDRVNLLGASPKGELLHCYTDPQMWYAEAPQTNALVPNAQTTAAWWVWTTAGQSRLDLFAVNADRTGMVQYTAMDPGTGKGYAWNHNPLGNPASFTNGALTSCSAHDYRIDIYGVQANGQATQLYYQWPGGEWDSNPSLGPAFPVGTTLVSCARRDYQWDVFGIDENGKLLCLYWYWGNGWRAKRFDMPVGGDWKLSAGCVRAPDQIDLYFVDAASGILRVALTTMDTPNTPTSNASPSPKIEAEVIYPFRLRQVDLDRFKKMFPEDARLQALTLDDLVKYSQGKDPFGESAQPSPAPPPQSGRGAFTPCQWAWGVVAVDTVFVLIGFRGAVKLNLALDEAIARGAQLSSEIEEHARIIADTSASLYNKATAVVAVGGLIYGGGLFEPIYKAIVKSLDWWDMVLYGVAGLAEITAAFLTDGAALIAKIVYSISMAGFLVTDIERALEICSKPTGTQRLAEKAQLALPSSKAIVKKAVKTAKNEKATKVASKKKATKATRKK